MSEQYEKPYSYDEIIDQYGKFLADKLIQDPSHKWRMETRDRINS